MDDFEKWWLLQCTNGYFIHHYANDKELINAAWDASRELLILQIRDSIRSMALNNGLDQSSDASAIDEMLRNLL